MSYAANVAEAFRQTGVYVGRILKGEKPRDLPSVDQIRTGHQHEDRLGLIIPADVLATADEVIE